MPAPAREVCWCPGDGRNRFWEIARKQRPPRGRQAYQAGSRLSEKLAKIGDFVGKWLPGMTWEKGYTSFLGGRNAHRSHLRGISVPVAWRGQRTGRSRRKFRSVGTPRENPKDMEEEGVCCLHQCCQSLGCQGAWPQPGGYPQWDTVPLLEGSHGTRCRAAPSWGQSWGHVRGHQMCWRGTGTWWQSPWPPHSQPGTHRGFIPPPVLGAVAGKWAAREAVRLNGPSKTQEHMCAYH